MRLTRATNQAIQYACREFHYSRCCNWNVIGYNVYNDGDEWCGVVVFGVGANGRIGEEYGLPMGGVLELVRVALNGKQEYTSRCVVEALRRLKKDVPYCRLVVSYADMDQGHLGTIYQATNWIYVGETAIGSKKFIIHGERHHPRDVHHTKVLIDGRERPCPQNLEMVRKYIDPDATEEKSLGKRKYLYPMDKGMRKKIAPLAKPYPKTDKDWTPIDRGIFKKDKDKNKEEQ